jgi:hypothetical protein
MPDPDTSAVRPAGRRGPVDWFLRDRSTGRIVVVQWPNPALWVWVFITVVSRLGLVPDRAEEIRWVGVGALIAWAVDEIIRGDSPFRRLLGLIVLSWQVYRLIG